MLDRAESANDAWDEANIPVAHLVMRVMYTTQYLVRLHQFLSRGAFSEAQDAARGVDLSVLADFSSEQPQSLHDLFARQDAIERRYAWLHPILCSGPDSAERMVG